MLRLLWELFVGDWHIHNYVELERFYKKDNLDRYIGMVVICQCSKCKKLKKFES